MSTGRVPQERWLRIIPISLLMYTISFINRTNISLALPAISRDLHLNAAQAGQAAGVFFWGYLLLQIPGGYIAERWSAKWLIAVMLALCAAASRIAFVKPATTFRSRWNSAGTERTKFAN